MVDLQLGGLAKRYERALLTSDADRATVIAARLAANERLMAATCTATDSRIG